MANDRVARVIVVRIGTHPRRDKMFLRSQPVLVATSDIICDGIADGSFRLLRRADDGDARYLAVGGAHTSLEIATRRDIETSSKRNIFTEIWKPPLFPTVSRMLSRAELTHAAIFLGKFQTRKDL